MTDNVGIEKALHEMLEVLSKRPVWAVFLTNVGEILATFPRYDVLLSLLSENDIQKIVEVSRNHAEREIHLLDSVKLGNFQYSITVGADGVYFVFHFIDRYLLGMSFAGVHSIDGVVDAVIGSFGDLLGSVS